MKKEANYKTNSLIRGPKPRIPHLVLPFRLGSEHIHLSRLECHFHALVGFGETQDKSNVRKPRLKIIGRVCKQMTFVHPNNIVLGEAQSHLLVKSIYTT